jgi:predicted transcriptional regulator
LSSGKKKIKIEFEDAEGNKYNLSLDGDISKNKILKVYELMESLNTQVPLEAENNGKERRGLGQGYIRPGDNLMSVGSKIWYIIENKFPSSTFTSSDIQDMYEEEYKESMRLDAIATYLSRYANKGKLVRNKKGGKEWLYKIVVPEKAMAISKNAGSDYPNTKQFFDSTKSRNVQQGSTSSFEQAANNFSSLTEVN